MSNKRAQWSVSCYRPYLYITFMTAILGSYHGDDNCYSLTSTQQFPAIFGQSKVDDQIQRVENDSKKMRYYRHQGKKPGCTEILNAAYMCIGPPYPICYGQIVKARLVTSKSAHPCHPRDGKPTPFNTGVTN